MRVYAAELICSTGVLGFHTFKLALCIYNKLRSQAEILGWWAFDVTFPGSNHLRSNRSGLNVSNGGWWNPKLTLKVNSFWKKIKGQKFCQSSVKHTHFHLKKKRKWFFRSQGHFKSLFIQGINLFQRESKNSKNCFNYKRALISLLIPIDRLIQRSVWFVSDERVDIDYTLKQIILYFQLWNEKNKQKEMVIKINI